MNHQKISISLLALVCLFSLQACNFYYGGGRHRHPAPPPHRHPPHGRPGHGHGGGWHGPGRHHQMLSASELNASAFNLAVDYSIDLEAASKIISFASGENTQLLAEMGLTDDELASLAKLEMPSREVLVKISTQLKEDDAKIEAIFADFIADIKAEEP